MLRCILGQKALNILGRIDDYPCVGEVQKPEKTLDGHHFSIFLHLKLDRPDPLY